MKTIEEIRNEIGIKYGFQSWNEYMLFMLKSKVHIQRINIVIDQAVSEYHAQFEKQSEPTEITDDEIEEMANKAYTDDLFDLMQYVTNLLYAAFDLRMYTSEFDVWVEEKVGELKDYYRNNGKQLEPNIDITDEHIQNYARRFCTTSNGLLSPLVETGIITGAKAMRDGNIKSDTK